MMKHVVRTIVGWIVISLILSALLFSLDNKSSGLGETIISIFSVAIALFLVSVVCTLGISLILWIPLGYLVGWMTIAVIQAVIEMVRNVKNSANRHGIILQQMGGFSDPSAQKQAKISKEQRALVAFVRKARERGLTNEQISLNLQHNGWPADSITWLLNFTGQQS